MIRKFITKSRIAVLIALAALLSIGVAMPKAVAAEKPAAAGIVIERFLTVVRDPKSGKEHSLVALILSNGQPVTATAASLKDAAAKDLAEARVQDARRDGSRRRTTFNPPCVPSESPTVVDVQFMLQSGPVSVYQLTYSNGAQQVMAINQQTGEVTLGPVVGGC